MHVPATQKSNTNSRIQSQRPGTFLDFATAKSLIMAIKSSLSHAECLTQCSWELDWLIFPESWMFGGDYQLAWVWKKNARRYSWWPSKLSTFLARSQHWEKCPAHAYQWSVCTKKAQCWCFLAHRLWIYQQTGQSDIVRQQMILSKSKNKMKIKAKYSIN